MRPKGGNKDVLKVCGSDVLSAHLDHARSVGVGGRQQRAKAKVVCKHHMTCVACPGHDLRIACSMVSDTGPMNGFETVALENRYPLRGEVHVDYQLHRIDNGISISSARQAAYDKASRMSSASR